MAEQTKAELKEALAEAVATIAELEGRIAALEAQVPNQDFGPVFGPNAVPLEAR